MSTPLTSRGYAAIRHLLATTHLSTLPPVAAAVDEDRRTIDLEKLEGWHYSSGEYVLVDALKAYATANDGPRVAELCRLDRPCQEAVLASTRLWLGLDSDGFSE